MIKIKSLKTATTLILTLAGFIFPTSALAATLSTFPSNGTFNQGCNFALAINVDTLSVPTDGTDAILTYDVTKLKANSITSGTIYPDYPGNNIDATLGRITVSGLASVSQAFSSTGTLALVNFTVLPTAPVGPATINFDFDPSNLAKTTDSNVVARASSGGTPSDVLTSVTNGSYTFGTGSCTTQTPSGSTIVPGSSLPVGATTVATGSSVVQSKGGLLPSAGTEQLTSMIAIIAGSLMAFGILGLAIL